MTLNNMVETLNGLLLEVSSKVPNHILVADQAGDAPLWASYFDDDGNTVEWSSHYSASLKEFQFLLGRPLTREERCLFGLARYYWRNGDSCDPAIVQGIWSEGNPRGLCLGIGQLRDILKEIN